VRPRHGCFAGGKVCGDVRQSLHRGLRGAGAESCAKAARLGARRRYYSAPRYARVCAVRTAIFLLISCFAVGQQVDTKQRAKAVRDLARQGQDAIPKIAPFVADPDLSVRTEAVKALVEVGGPKTVDALVQAARDNDPEIQVRATDGLVNVYLP